MKNFINYVVKKQNYSPGFVKICLMFIYRWHPSETTSRQEIAKRAELMAQSSTYPCYYCVSNVKTLKNCKNGQTIGYVIKHSATADTKLINIIRPHELHLLLSTKAPTTPYRNICIFVLICCCTRRRCTYVQPILLLN